MEATLPDTLQRWSDARYALDHAIQNYLDHTIALQSNLHSAIPSMHDRKASTCLNCMTNPANDSRFVQAQTHLNQIRNSFLSINTLPLEILLRIFRFAAFHTLYTRYHTAVPNRFEQDDPKDLFVLTHVCTHWRKAMLGAQSFWSHFVFNTNGNPDIVGECAQTYLERAPDAPLSFYINDNRGHLRGPMSDNPVLEHLEARLDHLTRLTLMDLNPPVAIGIISFWMKKGKPGTLRTLILRARDYWHLGAIDTSQLSVTCERADSLLAPIRVLYLNGLRFHCDSSAYHNLVVLRMGGFTSNCSPRIDEMLAVLSPCPQLHTLRLSAMSIRPSDTSFEPVYMTNLEHLSMIDLSSRSFSLLLPVIFPRSQNLAFRIKVPQTSRRPDPGGKAVFDIVCLFLTRTNTTRLFIQEWIATEPYNIASLLSAVPNLHTLILHFSCSNSAPVSDLIRLDESKATYTPVCSRLHTMYLIHGLFSTRIIQQIVEAHHLQKLWLFSCTIDPSKDELYNWLESRVKNIKFGAELARAESVGWYHLMD